jgi:hypothetical protein
MEILESSCARAGRMASMLPRRLLPLVVLSSCILTGQTQRASPAGAIFTQAAPSVVSVEAYNDTGQVGWKGTGFVVAPDGKILTNYHVIRNSKQAAVRLANGDTYDTVLVLDVDRRKDIAVLKIRAVDLPALRLGASGACQIGDAVYSLSNPLGLANTLSEGIISGIRAMNGYRLFQITAPISHGSSGGPLLNAQGEVIGITTASREGGQSLNFAIPIDYARGELASSHVELPLSAFYDPLPGAQPPGFAPGTPPNIPDEARKSIEAYLVGRLNILTVEDARKLLGDPVTHTYNYDSARNVVSETYSFADPTRRFQHIAMAFDSNTKRLLIVWVYPASMTWNDCKRLWGEDVHETKTPDGTKVRHYNARRLNVYLDTHDKVKSVGYY